MNLNAVRKVVTSKYVIANIVNVIGVGCDIAAIKCISKEYNEYKRCQELGVDYHANMENVNKFCKLLASGVTLTFVSAGMRVNASRQLVKAQNDYIMMLANKLDTVQDGYGKLYNKWIQSLNLANDITEIGSLHMNREHFAQYDVDLSKLSHKYVGLATYNGLADYEVVRTRAINTLHNA